MKNLLLSIFALLVAVGFIMLVILQLAEGLIPLIFGSVAFLVATFEGKRSL